MYTAKELEELMRIIIARGMQIEPGGIDHKHNEVVPGAPRSPIKLHICTPGLRKEARLTEDDMQQIVYMWWSYIERHRLMVPAIGGVPRVGEKFATMLQLYVREQTGRRIPIVQTEKIIKADGTREIGHVIPSKEYPSGDIWLIDDLVNWGRSKFEAHDRYTQAGYRVTDSLVAVDYGVGAVQLLRDKGVRLHSLLQLDSILLFGAQEKLMDMSIISKTKAYLAASRLANTALPKTGSAVDKTA